MPEEEKQTSFDNDALATQLGGVFRQSLHDFAAEQEQRARSIHQEQQQAEAQATYNQRQAQDPVSSAVIPVVAPHLNAAILEAQDAKDAAMFYGATPEANKHQDAIEGAFNRMKAQGTPLKREELWHWHRGKNLKQFVEAEVASQQAAAQRAKEAAETGGGQREERSTNPALRDPHNASFEDLDKALKNVSF